MKKKRIRILALLMSIFMLLSYSEVFAASHYENPESTAWSNTTYFKEGTTESNAPTISLVYLEKGADGKLKEVTPKTPTKKADGTIENADFYVGLKLSNFGQYKAMADGVGNIDIPIVYDFSYISLYAGSGAAAVTSNEATIGLNSFKTKVFEDTQNAVINDPENKLDGSSYLNKTFGKVLIPDMQDSPVIPTALYDLTIESLTAPNEVKSYMGGTGSYLSGLLLSITPNGDAPAAELTKAANLINTDYVIVAQAKVKKIPDNGAALPVLSIAPSSTLTATLGSLGMTYGNAGTPWHPYVILDDSGVDIFPAGKATVSIKTDVNGTEATLTDTISVEETDTTVKFSDIKDKLSDPTPPSNDKYFAGWAASSGGAVLKDSDTISIATADGNKSVKVFAVFATDGIKTISSLSGGSDNKAVYGGTIPFLSTMTVGGTKQSNTSYSGAKIGTNGLNLYRQTGTNTWEEVTSSTTYNVGANVFTVATGMPGTAGVVQYTNGSNTTFTINAAKKTLTLKFAATSTGSTNKEYDGTATASGITPSYPDNAKVDSSDELPAFGTINYTYTGTNAANVGTNKDIKAAFAGTAPNNAKYVLALPANGATGVKGNITAKPITATLTVPTDKVYNGQTQAAVTANVTGATLTAGTDYTITYKKSGADADPKNADTYDVAFNLTNSNYSIASAPTGQYTIGQATLNITGLTITTSQIDGNTEDKTLSAKVSDFTSNKIGTDDVNITYTVVVDKDKIKNGDNTGSAPKSADFVITDGAQAGNYTKGSISNVTVKVTTLPIATGWTTASANAIKAVLDKYKTADTLNSTTVAAITAELNALTGLKVKDNATPTPNEYPVTVTWTAPTLDATFKGGNATFTAAVNVTGGAAVLSFTPDETVNVEAVTLTKPSDIALPTDVGVAVTLPYATEATKGEIDVDGTKVHYTIAWTQNGSTVTTITPADTTPIEVDGVITYLDAPDWMTLPTDNTIKATVSAGAVTITSVVAVDKITMDASSSDNDTQEAMEAKLPEKITLKDDGGNDIDVEVTWTAKSGSPAWDRTGGTYTYVPDFKNSADAAKYQLATGVTLPEATIEVKAIELEIPNDTFATKSIAKGTEATTHEDLGLTMEGDIVVDGTTVHYTVAWTTPVSDLDTKKASQSKEFEGTLTFTNAPAWLTLPDGTDPTAKTLTVKQTIYTPADVEAVDFADATKTALADVADKKILASDGANADLDGIAGLLPTDIKVVDKDGNEYDAKLEWTLADGTTHTPTDGEYAYTSVIVSTDADATKLTAPTAKITVEPVKANYDPTIFNQVSVKKGAKVEKFEDLGFITQGTAEIIPEVEGLKVAYTVSWTPSYEGITDNTGEHKFEGTISFKDAPEWLTTPDKLTGEKTVKVVADEPSSGRGGASRSVTYAVTFSAGAHGTIVSGKKSITVTKDKVVTELPVVKAKDGYKFLGWSQDGGKTVINIEETPIIKTTTLTAVYEEVVEETPVPTDKPLLPTKFTKPYASGYDGDVFLPDNNITRAELATMIARLIYEDELPNGSYRSSFSDVSSDAWYNKYIGYLESYGILNGYEEDGEMVFKPEQTITRAEMATVITRAQRYAIDHSDSTFWDVENDYWAKDYITTLAGKGIITGYADGSFGATSPLTRAEAVVIINRLLDPSTAIVTFTPVDISNHWAKQEIILAVNERQVNGTGEEATPEPEETPAPEATAEPEADATAEPTATPAE